MRIFYNLDDAQGKIKNAVVTVGSFDGVHAGHKAILKRLNQIAAEQEGESTLITFNPHPRKVLYPHQTDLKLINSQEEKMELLSETGLQNLIVIPFTLEFSKTTSSAFVKNILVDKLDCKVVVVGPNHHFGHNRQGDYSYLYKLGKELAFAVEEISILDVENEIISSTKIRKAIMEGNMQRANAYLDNQYFIKSRLEPVSKTIDGRIWNFYAVTITETEKLLPPPGLYAAQLKSKLFAQKGFVFIANNQPPCFEILLYCIENQQFDSNGLVKILLHKRLETFTMSEATLITSQQLNDAIETVNELLY